MSAEDLIEIRQQNLKDYCILFESWPGPSWEEEGGTCPCQADQSPSVQHMPQGLQGRQLSQVGVPIKAHVCDTIRRLFRAIYDPASIDVFFHLSINLTILL